ncbi:GDSL esterase/lipase At4g28780 [Linum grandiflorum]
MLYSFPTMRTTATTAVVLLAVAVTAVVSPVEGQDPALAPTLAPAPAPGPASAPPARAFMVFGDSLVDAGNNNYLLTTARADTPPNGIDYPGQVPTGRFSNGLNFADLIAEALGIQSPLPFLDPDLNGDKLLAGANFASAGIGMYQQLQMFLEYKHKVAGVVGPAKAQELVRKAVFLVTCGGNDFVNNYFLTPVAPRRYQFNLSDYCGFVISHYKKILLSLYELGARRILVTGTGPLGCIPAELAFYQSDNGDCATEPQQAAMIFNPRLFDMVDNLNRDIGSDIFISANAFSLKMDMIEKPQLYGFKTAKIACCGQGLYNGLGTCTEMSNLCANRNDYVFWDPYHPTEKALRLMVKKLLNSTSRNDIRPMNLLTMMAVDAAAAAAPQP